MRQAGILAAAAIHALDHHHADLRRDVDNARRLAAGLSALAGVTIDLAGVQSNIVRFEVACDSNAYATLCYERGVYMLPNGQHGMRAVLHRDIADGDVDSALEIMAGALAELASAQN